MGCRIQNRRAVKYNVGVACLASRCLGDLFCLDPAAVEFACSPRRRPPTERKASLDPFVGCPQAEQETRHGDSKLSGRPLDIEPKGREGLRSEPSASQHRIPLPLCPPPPSRRWWRELLTQALHCGVEVDPEPIGGRCQCSWVQSESGGKGKGQTSSFHRLNSTRAILRASCRHFAPLRRRPTACQRQSGGPPVHIVPPPPQLRASSTHHPARTDRPSNLENQAPRRFETASLGSTSGSCVSRTNPAPARKKRIVVDADRIEHTRVPDPPPRS